MSLPFRLYETVRVKSTGKLGVIVDECYHNKKLSPLYTIEILDQQKCGDPSKDLVFCKWDEIEHEE